MHFLAYFYTLRHFNHAKYIVQSWRSWKPGEMDFSHNWSQRGEMSEAYDKDKPVTKGPLNIP